MWFRLYRRKPRTCLFFGCNMRVSDNDKYTACELSRLNCVAMDLPLSSTILQSAHSTYMTCICFYYSRCTKIIHTQTHSLRHTHKLLWIQRITRAEIANDFICCVFGFPVRFQSLRETNFESPISEDEENRNLNRIHLVAAPVEFCFQFLHHATCHRWNRNNQFNHRTTTKENTSTQPTNQPINRPTDQLVLKSKSN